ncbi:P-loop containing nucleoside triphosphate hydrolase protein [Xylaria cubensis]|nr:P-loop containing nucleoside triphosphate hydrolase protein [Xylaria cubensis]
MAADDSGQLSHGKIAIEIDALNRTAVSTAKMPSIQVMDGLVSHGEQHGAELIQNPSRPEKSAAESPQPKPESDRANQSPTTEQLVEDDKVSPHKLLNESITTFYRGAETLATRRRAAKLRLLQSKSYLDLLEDRILELEGKFGKYLNAQNDDVKEAPTTVPGSHLSICHLSWFQFRGSRQTGPKVSSVYWEHVPEIDLSLKSMIEILTEEPKYGDNMIRNMEIEPGMSDNRLLLGSNINQQDQSTSRHDTSAPYLIRIRSPLLLKMLADVTGLQTVVGPHRHILLFFKPFKLLVAYAAQIRDRVKTLSSSLLDVSSETQEPQKEKEPPKEGPPKETETAEARESLRLLCSVLDQYLQPKIDIRFGSSQVPSTITYEDLWYLFKAGDEVRTTGKDQIQLFRIIKVTGGREALTRWRDPPPDHASVKLKEKGYLPGSFIIECFYIHYDGIQFGPVNETFQIPKFHGDRDITSLPIMPLRYDERCAELRKDLLKRGNEFAKLCNPEQVAHKQYKGLTLDKRQDQVHSEVIIDFQLAFIEKPESKPVIDINNIVGDDRRELENVWSRTDPCDRDGCCGNDFIFDDYEVDEKERKDFKSSKRSLLDTQLKVEKLSDDHKRLLPPKVFGFVLRTRKWATFDIDLLREVKYTEGWNKLVIDSLTRDTILALVQTHEKKDSLDPSDEDPTVSVDLVRGKGEGLIILLHGEPGVGKTSTAECVADYTKRPLFAVTCGDIGDNAQLVETNLERNFQLAHKWGCVLLLDEADIFLSKRDNTNITRNAIVSVFLRTLEYYSGILFLTTNRIGTIDRAFKSRIHLSLYYPKLDLEKSLTIWKNSVDTLKDETQESSPIKIDDEQVLKFAKKQFKKLEKDGLRPWNGRQIRNAFQTAIAIAKFDAKHKDMEVVLRAEHFKKVAKSAVDFDLYLNELHKGKDEAQLARENFWRHDDWIGHPMLTHRAEPVEPYRKLNGKRKKTNVHAQSSDSEDTFSTSSDTDDPTGDMDGNNTHSSSKRARARAFSESSSDNEARKSKYGSERKKR